MTVRPLFLLLTCAGVLGALVWVMLADPEGPSPAGATSSTIEEQSAAPQLAETSLAEQNQSAADREASSYRVRVLLPDGTPQAHAKLRVARDVIHTNEQAWQTAVRFPDQILWQAAGWDEVHADAEGEVTLAGPGPVVAAVLSPDHCGHVVCGMDPETFEARPPEDGAEAAVLQLRAQSMIEVLPLSAEGELLKEGIFLSGSARVARGPLYRDGEPMRRISAAVGKLPDGRWFFSRTLSAKSQERFGDRMEDLAYRVDLRLGRLEVGADFDAQTTGPLELRLPAFGEMLLTLQGYPEGVRPYLLQADGRINSRDTFTRPQREGEAFLIPQVPVGQEYEVRLMTTPHPDDPQPVLRGVGPEEIRVAGPQAAGERVAHTLVFQAPPGSYYGRLVLPEDCEWEPWQVFGSRARSWKARMVLADGLQYTDTLDLTLYPGGEFVARVPYRVRESQHPEWIGDVLFEFEDARPLWVVSSQAMPSFDQAVDLGEVQLSRDHALLRVRVVDQAGDPIEGAKVERSLLQSAVGEEAKWGHAWGSPQARTQEDGELWITDRDWYTELQLFPPESGKSSSQRIERLRVEVSAEGHLTQRQEFGPQTRELTVVLPRAATVYGSLGPVPARTTVSLGFCEPGRGLQEESSQLLPVERVSTRETEDMLEFEIASVPAGSWDFVVQVNGLGLADGLRIPGVVISGEPEQEPDALQNIPLGDWMGVAAMRFVDAQGRELSMAERRSVALVLSDPGLPRQSRSSTLTWAAVWEVPIPAAGIGPVELAVDGYRAVRVERLLPGVHEIPCIPAESVRVQLTGVPEVDDLGPVVIAVKRDDGSEIGFSQLWQGEALEFFYSAPTEHRATISWYRSGRIEVHELKAQDLAAAGDGAGNVEIAWPFADRD